MGCLRCFLCSVTLPPQEARASRAVELMVAHVENLKRRLDRNVAALKDAKKLMLQQQQESVGSAVDAGALSGSEQV